MKKVKAGGIMDTMLDEKGVLDSKPFSLINNSFFSPPYKVPLIGVEPISAT